MENEKLDRTFKIVMMELTADQLKLEEDLINVINSTEESTKKINTIKQILASIASIEASLVKFNSMIVPNGQNNEQQTKNN